MPSRGRGRTSPRSSASLRSRQGDAECAPCQDLQDLSQAQAVKGAA